MWTMEGCMAEERWRNVMLCTLWHMHLALRKLGRLYEERICMIFGFAKVRLDCTEIYAHMCMITLGGIFQLWDFAESMQHPPYSTQSLGQGIGTSHLLPKQLRNFRLIYLIISLVKTILLRVIIELMKELFMS